MAVFYGTNGADTIRGGAGDDLILGYPNGGDPALDTGGDGLIGGHGNDTIRGGGGADAIFPGVEADIVDGGTGNDRIFIGTDISGGIATVAVGASYSGGDGYDTLDLEQTAAPVDVSNATIGSDIEHLAMEVGYLGINQISGFERIDASFMRLTGSGSADLSDTTGFIFELQMGDGGETLVGGAIQIGSITSGAGDDSIVGFTNVSISVDGGGGNDTLTGAGYLAGGEGDDSLTGSAGADLLVTGTGRDTVNAGDGDDRIHLDGQPLAGSVIHGGIGHDTLELPGGSTDLTILTVDGIEALNQGSGNDGQVTMTVAQLQGLDSIVSPYGLFSLHVADSGSLDFSNASFQRTVIYLSDFGNTLVTAGGFPINGGSGADRVTVVGATASTIAGGGGDDTLTGGDSGDVLIADSGDDQLNGGGGDDVLTFSQATGALQITVSANQIAAGTDFGTDTFTSIEKVAGSDFNDTISATAGAVYLDGGLGDDTITGGGGNDTLFGGRGGDKLDGGGGDDVFVVGLGDAAAGERYTGGAGSDTISTFGNVNLTKATIDADVENLSGSLIYGATLLTGTQLQRFQSVSGLEIDLAGPTSVSMTGKTLSGPDYYFTLRASDGGNLISLAGAVTPDRMLLAGGSGNDTLIGSDTATRFRGGFGADRLVGGAGNDTFYADSIEGAIVAGDSFSGNGGNDTLFVDGVDISAATIDGIETLALVSSVSPFTGGSVSLTTAQVSSFTTISGGAEIHLTNAGAAHFLWQPSWGPTPTIFLNDGGDSVRVDGSAYFTFIGGAGSDTMEAGTSTFDHFHGGGGVDTVSYEHAGGSVKASLAAGQGTYGVALFDQYDSIENLIGSAYADRLEGDAGANRLDGGLGGDAMLGGAGDDVYVVDNASDKVYEYAGMGTDTVIASVSFRISNAVENLTLADGAGAINGIGSNINNMIMGNASANVLSDLGGDDTVHGGDGADRIGGGAGVDNYYGEAGNDVLVGSSGADLFDGGDGIDTVTFQTLGAANVYLDGSGTNSGAALGDTFVNVENIVGSDTKIDILVGDAAANKLQGLGANDQLFGKGGDDNLLGGDGADRLSGGAGMDVLTGGAGNDVFVFDLAPSVSDRDTIVDFSSGSDKIEISTAAFGGGLVAGAAANLIANAAPSSAGIQGPVFLYDTDNGRLSFDADGGGGGAAVLFAVLTGHPTLTGADLSLV